MTQNIKINPLKYPNVKCDKCGNETFIQATVLKCIPGLEVGAGTEDQYLDLPVYICSKCGEILARDRKDYKLMEFKEDEKETSKSDSNILLDDSKDENAKITKLIL